MAKALQPIPASGLSIPRANVLIGDVGSNYMIDVGDVETFSLSLEVEEVERYGRNFSMKTLRRSDVIQVNATISMSVVDMTKFMRALSVASKDDSFYTQQAVTDNAVTFQNVAGGRVYKVPHMKLASVSVTDGSGLVEFVPGLHVVVLEDSGYIQVLNTPAGADGSMIVTYDAPAISSSDDMLMAGIGSNFDIRKTVHVVGINAVGPRDMLVLHDVQMRPDGERAFQGEDDYAQLSITGRVFADPTKPEGFQLGHMITID